VIDAAGLENDPIEGFHVINRELREYSLKLSQKPQLIAANKMDLPQARENYERIEAAFKKEGFEVMPISGATGQGVKQLLLRIQQILSKMPETVETEEIKEYTIREEEPFKISKGGQVFSVSGSLVERLVAMTDLENESAVKRLQMTFKKIGLDEALKKKGIKQGDSVKIGDVEFYYME
jgi:GTP-binding protein